MSQRYIGGLIYNPPGGFSGQFDGSGDYLQLADSTAWDLTGDYTIEMWLYKSSSASQTFFQLGTSSNILLYQNASNAIIFYSGSAVITSSATAPLNQWNHFALVRSGGGSNNTVMYLNGVNVGQATNTTSFTGDASNGVRIGAEYPTGFEFTGYISNVRVVKGTAVYTTAFTPPNGPLQAIANTQLLTCAYSTFRDGSSNNFTITVNGNTAVSTQNPFPLTQLPNPALGNQGNGVYSMSQYQALRSQNLWPAIDPYFDFVTLLLHGNGTNGAQNNTFLDSSTNNFTITRNGNTTQGTFTPYGANWSNFFDASAATPLNFPDNDGFTFNADFTVECWFFATTLSEQKVLVGKWDNLQQEWLITINTSNTAEFHWAPYSVGGPAISSANAFSLNTWNHIAAVRSGSTITLYVNGVSVGTRTDGTAGTNRTSILTIGYLQYLGGNKFGGYISNVRVVKGTAVYASNFTPSASPLTAITNTQLLTCQSNRFIDNSANNFTATVNGVSIQRFSPFNPTTPYAAGTIGGSGYFDGTGDSLTAANNAAFRIGSGDFTVEGWVLFSNSGSTEAIISQFNSGGTGPGWTIYKKTTDVIEFYGGSGTITVTGTTALKARSWNHFAVVRNGSTITIYVNGVAGGTGTNSSFTDETTTALYVGARADGVPMTGYVSDARIVKGTAVYTANFTPPTAPLTAITNTSLLLNFTNGGIIDNAMMNDLETVGNAQISTSVSKFGGGSLAFDGSGDYLLIPNGENFNFGSGSWTIEFWVRFNTVGVRQVILSSGNGSGTNAPFFFELNNSLRLRFLIQTVAAGQIFVDTTYTPNANEWYHLAGVRDGSTATFYVNGVSVGSVTPGTSALTAITNQIVIGDYIGLGIPLNGYLDDVRFTKGYARYTANFTPQRSQWQDQ